MYSVFTRAWWRINKNWPGGREPHAGRKTYLRRGLTESEARQYCQNYNKKNDPGPLSVKAEFERE